MRYLRKVLKNDDTADFFKKCAKKERMQQKATKIATGF